ncbi:nitrogenase component 1 [Sporomusa termitida]|uniref:Light-independent protochlorophyllide reductase subunit B n=1 Tax=Sporomusa termitida TaxID=2377 RepID=A0A517DP06_9FIRM|nr:nitrogenase component 1 [Sporomusa termitida]QDR79100.1 Light-independent protochlorophyllide reductase subunit B [Sporomusa termitida]
MADPQWHDVQSCFNACALTGAAAFFAGIEDAVIVGNGPLWCYFYALRFLEHSCPDIANRFFCSQVDNNAVIYGTEEALLATLQTVKETTRPSVVFIESSCSVSLIGDDLAAIARQAAMPCPVICLESGGLSGGLQEGYRAAAKAYFSAIPLPQGLPRKAGTVNLLGATYGYYNAVSDVQEIKRLLGAAGYHVLACPGAGSCQDDIAVMAQAELNVVLHAELGLETALLLQAQYGIPYVAGLPPYGVEGSWDWLCSVAQVSGRTKQALAIAGQERALLERRLRNATQEMERIWGEMWFNQVLVAAPASTALGIAQAVRREWVDTTRLTIIAQGGILQPQIPAGLGRVIDAQKDGQALADCLNQLTAGLLLASSNERAWLYRSQQQAVVYQNIALPVYDEIRLSHRPFMGLQGAVHLLECLWERYIAVCQHP